MEETGKDSIKGNTQSQALRVKGILTVKARVLVRVSYSQVECPV